jgi:hypothetical protein
MTTDKGEAMRHHRSSVVGVLGLALGFGAVLLGGCGALTKSDGQKLTPLEGAKVTQKALNDSWKSVQLAFAEARATAEEAEKRGTALTTGQITLAQWTRFAELDRKVLASGRELAQVTQAWETGASKDEARLQQLTGDLFKLFGDTSGLAKAFGLTIPGLPDPPKPSSSLSFALAALPLAVARRRRLLAMRLPEDPSLALAQLEALGVRGISGGAGSDTAVIVAGIAANMIAAGAPTVAALVIKNPEDRAQAEAAAALLAKFISGVADKLPGIMAGIADPSTIKLADLWDEDAGQVLARVRAERAKSG